MEDQDITDRLIQVGRIVNLPVIDHLIITDINYLSFADIGLMQELENSIKYVPSYELAQRIRAEANALMEQKIEEAKFVMAAKMKAEGFDLNVIVKITGLSLEEVEKIK